MSKKKSKGVVFDSSSRHGVGVYEDAEPRLGHCDLVQGYRHLQTETDAMRSKLKAEIRRKSILAAELRFLQKRRKYLVTANDNNMNPSQELTTYVHTRNLPKQSKVYESSQRVLPFVPEPKRIKQRQYMAEQTATTTHKKTSLGGKQVAKRTTPVSNLNQKEKRSSRKEVVDPNVTEKYGKERRMYENEYAASMNSIPAFDLNEASFPCFDLNETSTGMRMS